MSARDLIYLLLLVAATAITRSTLVLLGSRVRLPERLETALRYAPACALAAILVPSLIATPQDALMGLAGTPTFWAAVATGLTMLWSRSMILAIALGMLAFWLVRWAAWAG